MSEDPLRERLAACVGTDFQTRRASPDRVCSTLVRRWLEAFGDSNPAYLDQQANRASGRAGTFAPPAMLPAFTAPGLAECRSGALRSSALGSALEELGFITPGTGIQQNYAADLRIGDQVTEVHWPESISERKQTRLGAGYFITYRSDFSNQHGQLVGTQRLSTFAFQPDSAGEAPEAKTSGGNSRRAGGEAGPGDWDALPPAEITLDRMGIIACTAAMGDFNPPHYDPELAAANGFPDIFTDIYAGAGFTQSYVSNWAGPRARIEAIDVRLGVPLVAGATLQLSGSVVERRDRHLSLAVLGMCPAGMHLSATATITTPGT